MKVENDVLNVLDGTQRSGNTVKLMQQLDRNMYVRVNKVLEASGGKWDRKAKCHIFSGDATDRIEKIILTGSVIVPKNDFDFFPTPYDLSKRIVEIADIQDGCRVLEPSAGDGSIVHAISVCDPSKTRRIDIHAIEINPDMANRLSEYFDVQCADFLQCGDELGKFDRIIMNPPFSKQADLKHVTHAIKFLNPLGSLVSVMSSGVTFRENNATRTFRDLIKHRGGRFEELPEGTFKKSGTMVNTVLCIIPTP